MPSYKARNGKPFSLQGIAGEAEPFGVKLAWFLSKGYVPHYWQTIFHIMRKGDQLCRFRHLVAGRRGGKTLSAAWEMLFYLTHPEEFHHDAHGTEGFRPVRAWVLTKDYPTGMAALLTFRECLAQAGYTHGVEYKENRGNRWFEFENGSFLEFKTADDPESLRGAGLDIMWIDEAAFIADARAWEVSRPALSDRLGIVITTTTPSGKNWFYDEFWSEESMDDPNIGRVEYWSIDNPYFPKEEWEYMQVRYHPMLFKQEYCAAFDSMAGKELAGDWLHYYRSHEVPTDPDQPGKLAVDVFIGVDPAISLSDQADRFALAVIACTKDRSQWYLLELIADRIPFPDQVQLIADMHQKWTPQMIGIETNVYQAALAQQVVRLSTIPPIVEMPAKGKKFQRILAMAPLFRIGRVKIRPDHADFINEWVDYDSTLKNPKDDCLDAVEIALRTAGALLPDMPEVEQLREPHTVEELMKADMPGSEYQQYIVDVDEHLGSDW
jgi:predicted phage terminase large subunit-like protein